MAHYAFFGVVSDRAGVHKEYVGFGGFVGKGETFVDKCSSDKRRVELVHLATEILNMQFHKK